MSDVKKPTPPPFVPGAPRPPTISSRPPPAPLSGQPSPSRPPASGAGVSPSRPPAGPAPTSPSRPPLSGTSHSRPPIPGPPKPASLHEALKEAQALGGGTVSRPPPPAAAPTGKKAVLLVDDDARVRSELAKLLVEWYDVHEAGDGAAAAEMCTVLSPALIVCDVVMPKLDGFSLAKVLRSNPRLAKVPLVFLTSRQSSTDVMQGLSLGARAYIPKPFNAKDVVGKIRKMLG